MDLDLTLTDAALSTPISLSLLSLLNDARNEHGMRQHDYARYRLYCTQKVARLRSALHLTHADAQHAPQQNKANASGSNKLSKAAKARRGKKRQTPKGQSEANKGKGNTFTRKTIVADQVVDDRALQLLLFEAERSWAFAQDIRTASETPNTRAASSHARRSLVWAKHLAELTKALESRMDARSRAQLTAYVHNLRGGTAFDKGDWQGALKHLGIARQLLASLAEAAADSRAEALANSWLDAGEAQLRYCAYQLELGDATPDELVAAAASEDVCEEEQPGFAALRKELVELRGKRSTTRAGAGVSVEWHGETIAIRNPELVDAFGRVRSAEEALAAAVSAQQGDTGKKAVTTAKGYKRQRLTSAQRTAKKRASAPTDADGADAGATGSATLVSQTGARTEMDPYDRALAALTDAEELARRLVEDNAAALAKSHSARYEAAGAQLRRAHDVLAYRLLCLRVRRNAHLVEQVEAKAARREKRAQAALEKRLEQERKGKAPKARKEGEEPKRLREKRRNKNAASKSGSKKRTRTKSSTYKRKPARSGVKRARRSLSAAREANARRVAEEKARRRAARSVPGLAKLLDGAEASLNAMASLGLVESQPDVSSLVDAKSAWYRAEMLRVLARAYALNGALDHALLLLARAALFVRQARQAAELAEEEERANEEAPPAMVESTLQRIEQRIVDAQRDAQRQLYRAQHGLVDEAGLDKKKPSATTSQRDTKAGQAMRDLAAKYVSFDAVDLQNATLLDETRERELENELREELAKQQQSAAPAPSKPAKKEAPKAKPAPAAAAPKAAPKQQASKPILETAKEQIVSAKDAVVEQLAPPSAGEPYDPGNAEQEEEEAAAAAAAQQKKGWLGGWFGGAK